MTISESTDATAQWTVESAIPEHVRKHILDIRSSPSLKEDTASMFAFLHTVRLLKVTPRTGWLNHGISNPGMLL